MKKNLVTKVMSLLLVGVMMLGLIACGNEQPKESSEAPAPSKSEAPAPSKSEEAPAVEDEKVTYPMDTDVEVSVYLGGQATLNAEYDSYEKSYWHSKVAEVTGIPTKWVPKVQDNTAFEMMLADKKEAPDVFYLGYAGLAAYKQRCEDGVTLELTPYLEKYAPNYWEFINRPENAEFLKQITDDEGRHYFIASKRESDFNVTYMGPMIRKDWLDECGLDVPVTLEDYEKVLVAFKDKYGAALAGTYSDFKSAGIASGTGALTNVGGGFAVKDGKIIYDPLTAEWQKQIEVLADWKAKGLIDGDFFTADRNILRQKAAEGKAGLIFTAMSQLTNYIQDANDAGTGAEWIGIEYPRTAAGAPTTRIQTGAAWEDQVNTFVSAFVEEEKIPVVLAWIDYFYTEEGIVFSNFGIEGESYNMVNGEPDFSDLVKKDPSGMAQAVTKYGAWNGTFTGIQMEAFLKSKNSLTPAVVDAVYAWTNNTDAAKYFQPKLLLTPDEQQRYTDTYAPISTYVGQEVAAFINGEKKIDWATFTKDIEGMGIQKIVDDQNAAYVRYNAK